ncbi:Probable LRR receptor-like serine/threonine-protein kinase At3g47570 [Linum grandiflorum]
MKDYNQNSHFLSFLLISLHYLILNASGNNLTDQLALLEFKNSITNDPDGILASWNDSLHFCNWLGITCNTQQRVTSLSLSSCNLAGTLSPHISNFTFLQTLNLTTNSFTGQIPPNLTRCFELRTVLVEHNSIEGTIPEDIGLLSKLTRFRMGSNNLTGQLPASIGNLSQLVEFAVAYNNLNSSSLTVMTLIYNQFHGRIPEDIGLTVPNLRGYYISRNWMTGPIPQSFCNASKLYEINMNQNSLTGSIPTCFGILSGFMYLNVLSNLQGLFFNGNRLSGHIPASLGNLTQLNKLDLSNNQLEGAIPLNLASCQQLNLLDVSGNKLTGAIPRQIFSLSSLSGGLCLSRNSFVGELPGEIGNLENLEVLDLSYNNLTGGIPISIGDCKTLKTLFLQSNSFDGEIPSALASIKDMERLDLSMNKFTGEIPSGLQRIQALQYLNLSFNDLQGDVPDKGVFANIGFLSLTGNALLCGGVIELHLKDCPTAKTIKQKRADTVKLTLEIVLPSLTFLLLSATLYQWKLWRSRKKSVAVGDTILSHFVMVSYKDLHQGTNGFSDDNLIGSGGFGTIYKGVLDQLGPATLVAVKVLNIQENIRLAHKSLLAECNALKNVRHRNLVRVLTYCSSLDHKGNDFKALVFEFMSNGSLEDWLHSDRNLMSLVQRLNIMVDVASALHYLHDLCETPVVHCDLKPSNVLLDADMVAHVGDFGLARILSSNNNSPGNESSTIGIRGTFGYAPPGKETALIIVIECCYI